MRWGAVVAATMALALGGCGLFTRAPQPMDAIPGATQTGIASWYGPGFHGRRTANGEVYDQHGLTAAHRTLPHGTQVEVTNLANGRRVRVRINDRGPYVGGRVIDLSYAAAQHLDLVRPGIGEVRIEVLAPGIAPAPPLLAAALPAPAPPPIRVAASGSAMRSTADRIGPAIAAALPAALPAAARAGAPAGYAVQAGTYDDYARARRAQRRLHADGVPVRLTLIDAAEARYFQLRAGPFAQRSEADRVARRLAALGAPARVVRAGPGR